MLQFAHFHLEGPIDIRNTRPSIIHLAAFSEIWRKRQSATPVSCIVDLPPTYNEINRTSGVATKSLPLAKWQLIDCVENPDMVPDKIYWSVTPPRIHRVEKVVVIGEVVGVGIGVVSDQLQTLRQPLIQLDN